MMSLRLLPGLVLLALTVVRAEELPPDLRRLFPTQADVRVEAPGGLVRLDLPPEVLAACRPDLSDLRVLTAAGREVPFVVDSGAGMAEQAVVQETFEAKLLDVRREETTREDGPARYRETFTIVAPAAAAASGVWELVLTTRTPSFVRRLDVSATRADGSATALVENETLFRLRDPLREKVRIALPGATGVRLTINLAGDGDGYLDPTFRFESSHALDARERAVVPLEEISRTHADGRTIVELARPGGVMPDVLRLETTTPYFERAVEVWDEGPNGQEAELGAMPLFRIETPTRLEQREVAIRRARFERLRVEIDDGDSPPLEGLAFAAVLQQPSLLLFLPAAREGSAAVLYFGGGRAYAAQYDIARLGGLLRGSVRGPRVPAAIEMRTDLPRAELGPVQPNPLFDDAPLLAYAMQPGAELDTRLWTERRAFRVVPSAEGLSRVRLQPEDVARARRDLADVRVVDGEGRQWPYLLAGGPATEWWTLPVGEPTRSHAISRYPITLPAAPLELDRLVLETDALLIQRGYRVIATDEKKGERLVGQGTLERRPGRPHPLTIELRPMQATGLTLQIDDGDDAPLAFARARARLRLPELYLAAPPGEYALLVGNPTATPPRYELARVRDVVLAVASTPVVAGTSGANPDFSTRARFLRGGEGAQLLPQIALWTVLLGAVVVLTALTLRLARRDESPGERRS